MPIITRCLTKTKNRVVALLAIFILCGGIAWASVNGFPYTNDELQDTTRALLASLMALVMYIARVLQQPGSSVGKVVGGSIQTMGIALVMILVVREMTGGNLAAEMVTGAVVGMDGPRAGQRLREWFELFVQKPKGGGND